MKRTRIVVFSPSSKILALPKQEQETFLQELRLTLGVQEYGLDLDILFRCEESKLDEAVKIALKYELNMDVY